MRQAVAVIEVPTRGRGLFDVTRPLVGWVAEQGIGTGLLTVWCRHTSASLLVQENASPEVLLDIRDFFERLAPEDAGRYRHSDEGLDDMPAHLRAALTAVQLTVPVMDGAPALGTWQGIYLFEHRARPHRRSLALHLLGE
jgi:secondary thiamine-phosphate synthase enzyme